MLEELCRWRRINYVKAYTCLVIVLNLEDDFKDFICVSLRNGKKGTIF